VPEAANVHGRITTAGPSSISTRSRRRTLFRAPTDGLCCQTLAAQSSIHHSAALKRFWKAVPFYGSSRTLSGSPARRCERSCASSQCPSALNSSSSTPITELHVKAD
jgi:hypothetical protein